MGQSDAKRDHNLSKRTGVYAERERAGPVRPVDLGLRGAIWERNRIRGPRRRPRGGSKALASGGSTLDPGGAGLRQYA